MSDSIFTRARDRVSRAAERAAQAAPVVVEQRAEPAPVARAEKPKKAKRAEVIDAPRQAARPLRLPRLTSIGSLAKLAGAAFIWYWGLGNTQAFLSDLLAPTTVGLLWAAGVQALLTALESDFFGGRRGSRIALGALVLDTLTNVVGVWLYVPNLPNTRVYQILNSVFPALPDQFDSGAPRFVVAVVAGVLIAWAPEALWKSASS